MYVLDTNVVSEFIKPRPDAGVMSWLAATPREALLLPSVVVAEIYFGIELLPPDKRRDALLAFTDAFVESGGINGIAAFSGAEARAYARIGATRHKNGRPIKEMDAQIAATAFVRNLPVVTRNVRDFEGCGVKIVNPWEGK